MIISVVYLVALIVYLKFFFVSVINIFNLHKSLSILTPELSPLVSENECHNWPFICLNIPVLCESELTIRKALERLQLLKYPQKRLRVNIITTEKERTYFNGAFPTGLYINDVIHKANSQLSSPIFHHIHCPDIQGDKAFQLNFAITQLDISESRDNIFVGVYDIDSIPNEQSLLQVGIENNADRNLRVFQEFSFYLGNFNQLNWFMKLSAIYQTLWTLSYELPTLLNQYKLLTTATSTWLTRLLKYRLTYCIGHGHFIRLDALFDIGLYPKHVLTEDLYLGYLLSFYKIPVKPLLLVHNSTMPVDSRSLFLQASRWFGGELKLIQARKIAKRNAKYHHVLDNLAFIRRFFGLVKWVFGSPIIIIVAGYCVYMQFWCLLGIGGLGLVLYSLIRYGYFFSKLSLVRELIKDSLYLSQKEILMLTLYCPIRCMLNMVGPFIFLGKAFLLRMRGQSFDFIPTSATERKLANKVNRKMQ